MQLVLRESSGNSVPSARPHAETCPNIRVPNSRSDRCWTAKSWNRNCASNSSHASSGRTYFGRRGRGYQFKHQKSICSTGSITLCCVSNIMWATTLSIPCARGQELLQADTNAGICLLLVAVSSVCWASRHPDQTPSDRRVRLHKGWH
jgi:hypothetical protein